MKKSISMMALATLALGCAQPQKPMTAEEAAYDRYLDERIAKRDAQRVPTAVVGMNCFGHGAGYIHSFAIEEPIYGQISRGMVSGFSCGGTLGGGYLLPRTWTPGMKVKVRWNRPIKGEDNWIEKTTTIFPYDKPGDIYAHFFANDEVRVVVSQVGALNPNHPIPPTATVPPPEPE